MCVGGAEGAVHLSSSSAGGPFVAIYARSFQPLRRCTTVTTSRGGTTAAAGVGALRGDTGRAADAGGAGAGGADAGTGARGVIACRPNAMGQSRNRQTRVSTPHVLRARVAFARM